MIEYFVAINGNDQNNGSREAPFASIAGARDFLRKQKNNLPQGEITVTVLPGEYLIKNAITFDNRDSGTTDSPICYRAAELGTVCLNSGITLKWEDFHPVSQDMRERFCSDEIFQNVRQLDLTQYGLTKEDWGSLYAYGAYTAASKYKDGIGPMYCELFCGEDRMITARYPNDGYLKINEVLDNGDASEVNTNGKWVKLLEKWDNMQSPRGGSFTLDAQTKQRIRHWKSNKDLWIFGFFQFDWADASTRIATLDVEKGELTTEHAGWYGFSSGGRFYFYNVLEELDSPGEWYLDRDTGMLYFYPPEGSDEKEISLTVSTGDLISIHNADYLSFCGFEMKGGRKNAITAEGNRNCIENCVIHRFGGGGITMTGTNNRVENCEMSRLGSFGIILNGGNRHTLTSGSNAAVNNCIHHWSEVIQTYQGAISLNGVGATANGNELHHSPHTAIFYSGNDHIIEHNHIYDVCLNTRDAGAIYSGRSYTWYGTLIRYNYLHDIGSPVLGEAHAIYFDDNLSGQTMYGNIMEDIHGAAVLVGGGREISIINNIIIRSDWSIHYDARGREGLLEGGWYGNPLAAHTEEVARLKEVDICSEIWAERYPRLSKLKWSLTPPNGVSEQEYYNDIDFATNCSYSLIKDNIFCQCEELWHVKHPSIDRYSEFTKEGNQMIGYKTKLTHLSGK